MLHLEKLLVHTKVGLNKLVQGDAWTKYNSPYRDGGTEYICRWRYVHLIM